MGVNFLHKKACIALLSLCFCTAAFSQESYRNLKGDVAVKQYFAKHKAQFGATDASLQQVKITGENTDATIGIRHIYVQQQLNGLDVVNGTAALHLKTDGTVAHAVYQFSDVAGASGTSASVSINDAVRQAMQEAGISMPQTLAVKEAATGIEQKTIFKAANTTWDIPVRKAYLLNNKTNKVLLVWEVQLYLRQQQHYWIMYLDAATGKVVAKQDMVVKCDFGHPELETDEYLSRPPLTPLLAKAPAVTLTTTVVQGTEKVYNAGLPPNVKINLANDEQPDNANRTSAGIVNSYRVYDVPYEAPNHPGATHSLKATGGNATASPDGWHKENNLPAFQFTRGNNVWAFQDPSPGPLGGVPSADPTRTAYNNGGLAGTPVATEPFLFDYAVNLNGDPTTYQNAAIVNLFYWNNLMHDVFYQFGFDEASRNFEQSHNFSTGNKGTPAGQNDAVLAQAQDGGGTNNANMLTLADGTPGQMQMYLWTGSTPDSIVQIVSNTMPPPAAGKKYFSIQGALGNSALANNDLFTNPVLNRPYVIVQKNAAGVGTSSQGCGTGQMSAALPPSNDVNGKIVLIDRGGCSFAEKVLGAQLGNAVGVIVINNVPGAPPIAMGGADAPANAITIPSVMVTFEAGKEMKDALVDGAAIVGSLRKTVSNARRDGDLDNGIIAHEYGHGISTRLTAGGPNPLSRLGGDEQGGEGWSDNFALYMTTTQAELTPATPAHPNGVLPNRGIGSYVIYEPHATGGGIRPTQYSIDMNVNPVTYSFVKNPVYTIPHGIGYIWCTMLYEMQQAMIDIYGFNNDVYNAATPTAAKNVPAGAGGNNVAMRLVMEGLKLQPASPTFVQERDAILKADTLLYNGQHGCVLWKAFAKRGLGFSAVAGTFGVGDEVEQFNENPACNPQTILSISKTAPSIMTNNEEIDYTIVAKNISPAILAATNTIVSDTLPAFTTYISSDNGTVSGNVISWPLANLAKDSSVTHTVKVKVTHPTPATLVLNEDNEGPTNKFSSTNTGFQRFNLISTGAFSGTKVWFCEDYDIPGSNATLNLTAPVAIPAGGGSLIFNHRYATEAEYDGGIVEVSVDNTNWVHLNTFSQNGYNGVIPTANNPLIGTADLPSFTGSSPGYVQSIASLNAYAGQTIYFRFRFTSDPAGGSVEGGGWWVDDVYVASGASFVTNRAAANATNSSGKVMAEARTLIINSPCMSTLVKAIPEAPGLYTANNVCIDGFSNWMHFTRGDSLLLSVKRTAETSGLTPSDITIGVDTGTAAVFISAPYTSVFGDSSWWVLPRYWKITSNAALSSPAIMRFYYRPQEFTALQSKANSVINDNTARVYKITSNDNPDPALGQDSVDASEVVYPGYIFQGAVSNYRFVQFSVSQKFSSGGIGGTGVPFTPYIFTGTGNWTDRNNWINKAKPPFTLPGTKEIIVDPASGEALLNIPQTIAPGGKITVKAGKKLNVQGNLTIQQ